MKKAIILIVFVFTLQALFSQVIFIGSFFDNCGMGLCSGEEVELSVVGKTTNKVRVKIENGLARITVPIDLRTAFRGQLILKVYPSSRSNTTEIFCSRSRWFENCRIKNRGRYCTCRDEIRFCL